MHLRNIGILVCFVFVALSPLFSYALTFTRPLMPGAQGTEVTALQKILQSQGYLTTEPTGYFGTLTVGALKKFQAAHGIEALGGVGPQTRALLNTLDTAAPTDKTALIAALLAQVKILQAKIAALLAAQNASTTSTGAGGIGVPSTASLVTPAVVITPPAPPPAPPQGGPTAAIVKNIKTDFGAACNGVTDDSAAFTSFNSFVLNWQNTNTGLIELDIPSGSNCTIGGYVYIGLGAKQLLINGYGATLNNKNGTGVYGFGGIGEYQDNLHSPRTATVGAGATSVTLLTPSQTSLFKAGDWALMTGLDLQGIWHAGGWGFPSNQHYFEYVQITGANPSTGVISLAAPLKNTYKSTWPLYDNGVGMDAAGPATLYALGSSWDTQVEIRGLTFNYVNAYFGSAGRSVTFRDVTCLPQSNGVNGCTFPSQSLLWQAINMQAPGFTMEADKLVTSMVITGSTIYGVAFQSSSIDQLTMDSSNIIGSIVGTPKKALISNTIMGGLFPGAYSYGVSNELNCTNCTVTTDFRPGGMKEGGPSPYTGINDDYSMSNGIITAPNTLGALPWAVPGAQVYFGSGGSESVPFTVTDITQDANNTYVHTNLAGGFPPTSIWYQSPLGLFIQTDSVPSFTCTNCTGTSDFVSYGGGSAGIPLLSYFKRTYSMGKVDASVNYNYFGIQGKPVSIKINVTKPYTGSQASLTGSLYSSAVHPNLSAGADYQYINLKVAGERDITPTAVTGTQTGDTLLPTGSDWYILSQWGIPDISSENPSTWPIVTLEVITDKGYGSVSSSQMSGGSVSAPDTTAPSTPTGVTATAVSNSQINLSWTASTDNVGVTGYQVLRGGAQIASISGTSYSDTGLAASTNYSYTVKAIDAAGNISSASSAAGATTQAGAQQDTTPPTVTITAPSGQLAAGTTNVSLAVTTNENATCAYSTAAGTAFGSMTLFTSTGATSHSTTISGLSNGSSYTYYVKCKDTAVNISNDSSTSFSVANAVSTTLTQGLIGWWKFDEGSGTVAADSSGSGNSGTLVSGPTWATGHTGGALQFTAGPQVSVTGSAVIASQSALTYTAWVKNNSATLAGQQGIFALSGIHFALAVSSGGNLFSWIWNNNSWHDSADSGGFSDWDQWHYVAAVYDGSHVILYRDGAQVAISNAEIGAIPASTELDIAGHDSGAQYRWNGLIDDVRVYNRALSINEIQQLAAGNTAAAPKTTQLAAAATSNDALLASLKQKLLDILKTLSAFGH